MEDILPPDDSSFLAEYLSAKADADRSQSRLSKATNDLIYWMEANRRKTIKTYINELQTAQITYTQRTSYEINELGLRRALKAKTYDKYTVRKLDRKKLEAAMETGEVDPMAVAPFVAPKPGKPYLTFTPSKDSS